MKKNLSGILVLMCFICGCASTQKELNPQQRIYALENEVYMGLNVLVSLQDQLPNWVESGILSKDTENSIRYRIKQLIIAASTAVEGLNNIFIENQDADVNSGSVNYYIGYLSNILTTISDMNKEISQIGGIK